MPRAKQRSAVVSCTIFVISVFILMLISRCSEARGTMAEATEPPEPGIIALMYHHLLPKAEVGRYRGNNIVTYTEDFAAQLDWLVQNGFQTVTLTDVENFLYHDTPVPARAVLITFDDGYLSNAAYAYPLLKERGMHAVVFDVTGRLSETTQAMDTKYIQMMDEQTIRSTADVFEYASHTHDLHTFTGTGHSALTDDSKSQIESDLSSSLSFLETVPGANLNAFSYPFGFYTRTVQQVLKDHGILLAFRASGGVLTRQSDPYALPRYPVDTSVSMAEFKRYFDAVLHPAEGE